ncbi:MAG: hypothetical protein LBD75_04590 [Candidatus Peribacteria bacterium]|nr:hypothetical protein [Candidatus Peribacteria bacterium]
MKQYHQRKILVFAFLILGIIGTFFGIKAFSTSFSPQEPLPVRHTQPVSQLASSFTSVKT